MYNSSIPFILILMFYVAQPAYNLNYLLISLKFLITLFNIHGFLFYIYFVLLLLYYTDFLQCEHY